MKKITLSQGGKNKHLFAMVDDDDFEWINQYTWSAAARKHTFYAVTEGYIKNKTIYMHRLILGLTDPKICGDHKDRNGLNNQRGNLRIATKRQNNVNRIPLPNSSSRYLGVRVIPKKYKDKEYLYYIAQIDSTYIGSYKSETEAALAFNERATEIYGEFANLNIITQ